MKLVQLTGEIDWAWIDDELAPLCSDKGHAGDAANTILTAAGYNSRRILAWLRIILRLFLAALMTTSAGQPTTNPAS